MVRGSGDYPRIAQVIAKAKGFPKICYTWVVRDNHRKPISAIVILVTNTVILVANMIILRITRFVFGTNMVILGTNTVIERTNTVNIESSNCIYLRSFPLSKVYFVVLIKRLS